MDAEMEVLPNSPLLNGRGPSTATWGGGTLGRVGGRSNRRWVDQPTGLAEAIQSFATGGGVLDPGLNNNEGEAMEEFMNSAWRGQRTSEEREPSPLGERRTPPRGRSPILLLLNQWSSVGKSESVKGRVNKKVFKFWRLEYSQSAFVSLPLQKHLQSLR